MPPSEDEDLRIKVAIQSRDIETLWKRMDETRDDLKDVQDEQIAGKNRTIALYAGLITATLLLLVNAAILLTKLGVHP